MSDHNQSNMPDSHNNRGGTGGDKLDALLAAWHAANADRARAGRDRLLEALASSESTDQPQGARGVRVHEPTRSAHAPRKPHAKPWIRRFLMNRYSPVAAALIAMLVIGVMLLPNPSVAVAQVTTTMAPDGGRLDAVDKDGNTLGPCALKHTDVHAEVSGCLLRVTVKQIYANPYSDKIETVYTFPLSHKAAVDRMTMTIGSRVVQGEVKERELARKIYEAARDAGRIASLLEQQRPNIFTQSVANIEPRAEIVIEISYVELLEPVNGQYSFVFPTTVGPRYIPGGGSLEVDDRVSSSSVPGAPGFPSGIKARRGLVLTAPGRVSMLPDSPKGAVTPEWLQRALNTSATPVRPDASYAQPEVIGTFRVDYPDGSAEFGSVRSDGVGEVAGRWFIVPLPRGGGESSAAPSPGSPFATPTPQVPDADKITPMPVRPPMRAGHDIAISVSLDTGGPGLLSLSSPSHTVTGGGAAGASRATVELAKAGEIPNKDFVLNWSTAGSGIQEGVFTHSGEHGNFFSIILEPPARVEADQVVPRELCFVLDTSGSMNGWPIEKSKELMTKAIGQMRPTDTFNVITFAGATQVLWKTPRPASAENIAEAQALVAQQNGRGGTEMMTAINAALEQKSVKPGSVRPLRTVVFLTDAFVGNDVGIIDAIKKNRGTTRVFSLGVGNSVNRYLIDAMAKAGGGESEVVMLDQDADAAVARLTRRIQSPVLTDIALEFSGNLAITDVLPADENGHLPDLYDLRPLVLTGRYTAPGSGTLTIRGNTGRGPYERSINVTLPPMAQGSDAIATLWARAKVDSVTSKDLKGLQEGSFNAELKSEVVTLGETFQIMTPFTSFVAVDKLSVTVNGKPRLVNIPIELPAGSAWEGFFGGNRDAAMKEADAAFTQDHSKGAPVLGDIPVAGRALERLKANRSNLGRGSSEKPGDPGAVKGTEGFITRSASPAPPSAAEPARPATFAGSGGGKSEGPARDKLGFPVNSPAPGAAPAPTGAPVAPGQPAGGVATQGAEKGKDQSRPGTLEEKVIKRQVRVRSELNSRVAGDAPTGGAAVDTDDEEAAPDFYNGGVASVPEVYNELYSIDEPTQKQFEALLKASPLTPAQLGLLGIAPGASVGEQIASGRVPTLYVLRVGAGTSDAAAMKSAVTVLTAMTGGDPAVQELAAIAALMEARDASAAERAKALSDQSASKLEALFRHLKLAQTVERGLLQKVRRLSVDKAPASQELGVVVLVSSADKATLEAVKAAGLVLEVAEVEQRVLIGRVRMDKLEGLGLLEAVRRIEQDQ